MNDHMDGIIPSENEILSQLSRILRSQVLRDSGMLRNFLSFIVKETLNPEGILLKQYSVALHAFNRPPDFDPTTDPIVRIQASRLRRILEQYYREEGLADPVIIDLPKGSYVPIFKYSDKKDQTTPLEFYNSEEISYSIAIKSLKNLTPGEDTQLIVEGFTEEIMMELSRYSHIQVIRLAEEESQISGSAMARFYLEGSMRFAEKKVKISIGVNDTFNHQLIWSFQRKIDFENNDLIKIQEDVASAVATQISGIHGIICRKLYQESNWDNIHSTQAYVTFIHYHKYDKNPTEKSAIDLTKKLTALLQKEPLFAPGYAILANLYADSFALGLDRKNLEKAISNGEKAVELQPDNQMCQAYFGFALMLDDRIEEAELHLDKAISLNPNGLYHFGSVGWCYCMMGQLDKGFEMIRRSIGIDFQYPKWFHIGTILYYLEKKQYDKILHEANKMNQLEFHWTPLLKLVAYYHLPLKEEADKQFNILCSINPDFVNRPIEYIEVLIKSKAISSEIYKAFCSISRSANHNPVLRK
jgi:adenylate cyclase